MTSFDCRLKAIKACSACGNLHTSAFCCSKEKLKNKILVPMPESSQQHIKIERICFDCGDLLHGLNCLECDLTRKILEKAFQKFQNTSKSSNDNSNVVNAPREPFVVKQDPSVNSSQKSPLIDQKCCYECGDSLDGIFCQRCTCSIACFWEQTLLKFKHAQPESARIALTKLVQIENHKWQHLSTSLLPAWIRPLRLLVMMIMKDSYHCNHTLLFTEEPVNSLLWRDEHLEHNFRQLESDEFIKASVEILSNPK
ncbi:hypothetical protein Tco_1264333 [Tanacetum coccineum]